MERGLRRRAESAFSVPATASSAAAGNGGNAPSDWPSSPNSTPGKSSSSSGGGSSGRRSPASREMFDNFQPWVVATYGDAAKTKTVTRRKYARILRTLRGDSSGGGSGADGANSAENSKFRFWVKAKGFRVGPPPGHPKSPSFERTSIRRTSTSQDPPLYVPTATVKEGATGVERQVFKRVAVVEDFFDIIRGVHVDVEGRAGKHAGQKRTYRAITETYAFLPREAVTKFLLQCTDCQRKPVHGEAVNGGGAASGGGGAAASVGGGGGEAMEVEASESASPASPPSQGGPHSATAAAAAANTPPATPSPAPPALPPPAPPFLLHRRLHPPDIDYSLPITTTYLKHMRSLGYTDEDALKIDVEEVSNPTVEEMSLGRMVKRSRNGLYNGDNVSTPEPDAIDEDHYAGSRKDADKLKLMLLAWNYHTGRNGVTDLRLDERDHMPNAGATGDEVALWTGYHALGLKKTPGPREQSQSPVGGGSPLVGQGGGGIGARDAHETGSTHDETSSSGNKEDEEDDDDVDSDDRLDSHHYDPERLKAFNMFVRLFVDENLDRMVPISKQPKEKIQAIIDSCTRQFPEFAERARKRIRTYLKSCRRNKRSRDSNGVWDATRPTPAHLTSVQAEQILAQACENESQNAKRMRLGLEPVSQPMPLLPTDRTMELYSLAPSLVDKKPDVVMADCHAATATTTITTPSSSSASSSSVPSPPVLTTTSTPLAAGVSAASAVATTASTGVGPSPAPSPSSAPSAPGTLLPSQAITTTSSAHHPQTPHHAHLPTSHLHLGHLPVASTTSPSPLAISSSVSSPSVAALPFCKAMGGSMGVVDAKSSTPSTTAPALNGGVTTAPGLAAASQPAPSTLYRPNFTQAFQRSGAAAGSVGSNGNVGAVNPGAPVPSATGTYPGPLFPSSQFGPGGMIGNGTGPTDLSMKSKPLLSHKLNSAEMAAVKQLITGYRESAAFLLRSADELEQLLLQQQ
ncbi:nucleolar protein 4 isoform X2 [Ischnura elegans]|uniref:nucleolar protein 4 isoform X2 n=1 Tax=Ischnura elegans TaxID=197161 RepID=UPI001ED88565|nr:nucleolar protein 4 isoform X2 [Ischnura elegans]